MKKIIGFFVCMLLIVPAVPVVTSLKDNMINATIPCISQTSIADDCNKIQKLLASDDETCDYFGTVSLSGDTALFRGSRDNENRNESGSVYVLTKESSTPDLSFDISGGLGISLKIVNTGSTSVNDVLWSIHVEGGIFGRINKTVNGIIDIPAGELLTIVETGLFFGLGPIVISARVADEEKTAQGIQFLIVATVKK